MSDPSFPSQVELVEQNHPFRQWKQLQIPGTSFSVSGYSRSGDKVFFHIPGLRCSLDAGLCEGIQPEVVFLTHTHYDHCADLEYIVSKHQGMDLYAPAAALPYIDAYVRAQRELNHIAAFNPELGSRYRLHGVVDGDGFSFGKRDAYQVRVVECIHKIPCVGYAFSERRKRLLPDWEARKQQMLEAQQHKEFGQLMAQARKDGVEPYEEYDHPLFVYMGDTHADVFAHNPWLFEYPVIMTECTYLDESHETRALENGHTLWSQLKPFVEGHPNTTFVLHHFSLRHSDREILAFFQKEAQNSPHQLKNVVLWAHPQSLLPEQHQSHSEDSSL